MDRFFGLWIPRGEDYKKILDSGVWINRLSNKERLPKQIDELKTDDLVFLYQGFEDVKVKDTPFKEYIDENYLLDKKIVHVRSLGVGRVKEIDKENFSLKIDWQKDYKPSFWYVYFRQDGIWSFYDTNGKKEKELYNIVFYHKKQDYRWWYEQGVFKRYKSEQNISKKEEIMQENIITKNIPLNQILYGPPGTGKTYHTINKALEVIDKSVPQSRDEAKARFEELKDMGQIAFITFHQSYAYEEFVEGLRAKSNDNGNVNYSVEDGIFKQICHEALKPEPKSIYEVLLNILKNGSELDFETTQSTIHTTLNSNGGFNFSNQHSITKENILKVIEIIFDEEDFDEEDFVDFAPKGYKYTYYYFAKEIKRRYQDKDIQNEYIDSENYKNKNYVLIIDEINRGNISKIFGELITLIEPSKRIGNEEELQVTLPYSNESFGVPKNLYIIGTMNTADRSIALLDTALRRRFEFFEMMPKPELLSKDIDGINLQKLLEKINQRIEYLYDKDHTIGHSYLMQIDSKKELDKVMKNKIIPLLAEYFYDDWEKILLVLNDGFVKKSEQNASDLFGGIDSEYLEEEKFLYNIKDEFEKDAYFKIYKGVRDDND